MVQGINAGVTQGNTGAASSLIGGGLNAAGAAMGIPSAPKAPSGAMGNQAGQAYSGGNWWAAHGGEVPDHLSNLAKIYHPHLFCNGGMTDYRSGGTVPGKAEVKGDSPKNDTVPAVVSPGEIVLPRSVTQAEDAPARAAEFVKHLQKRKTEKKGYAAVAESRKKCNGGKV
jgi:hypothetical protein